MLEKGFNPSYAGGLVSNKVGKKIRDLEDIQINVNAADGEVNLFKTFEEDREGKVKILINESLAEKYDYEDQKGINKAALGDNTEEVINDLNAITKMHLNFLEILMNYQKIRTSQHTTFNTIKY